MEHIISIVCNVEWPKSRKNRNMKKKMKANGEKKNKYNELWIHLGNGKPLSQLCDFPTLIFTQKPGLHEPKSVREREKIGVEKYTNTNESAHGIYSITCARKILWLIFFASYFSIFVFLSCLLLVNKPFKILVHVRNLCLFSCANTKPLNTEYRMHISLKLDRAKEKQQLERKKKKLACYWPLH